MNEERRHYSRVAFGCAGQLLLDNQPIAVEVIDLSLKGSLVRTSAKLVLTVGTSGLLRVMLDDSGTEIRMQCTVAHCKEGHVGLANHSIDVDSITLLRRLVELNLGQDSLLQRELAALCSEVL